MIFTDRGTPQSYQNSDIFSVNTYKFTTPSSYHYVKIRTKPESGVKTFTREEATRKAGEDPDYMSRSLFDQIELGAIRPEAFPKWTVYA